MEWKRESKRRLIRNVLGFKVDRIYRLEVADRGK
jgi:hypothetical protein